MAWWLFGCHAHECNSVRQQQLLLLLQATYVTYICTASCMFTLLAQVFAANKT
jgi:hypothetical protein